MANRPDFQLTQIMEQENMGVKRAGFKQNPDTAIKKEACKKSSLVPVHRPLVPLLPKPSDRRSLPPRERPVLDESRPCGLLQCRNRPCRLESHRKYVNNKKRSRLRLSRRKEKTKIIADAIPALESTCDTLDVRSVVTPDYPFEEFQWDPMFRSLFREFFTKIVDKMLMVVMPPSRNAEIHRASLEQSRNRLYRNCVSSRAVCINTIGSAYVYLAGRISAVPDESKGLLIQDKLMKTVRSMLKNYNPKLHAGSVLAIMSTLILVDLVARSDRTDAMRAHRKALSSVVDSYGGLHNFGTFMHFALAMDRITAIYLELPSLYTDWASLNIPVQRAPLHPQIYGSFFNADPRSGELDLDVINLCKEACRAIEILEGEHYSFDSSEIREFTPEIHYLEFLRNRVVAKFTHLNARFSTSNTQSRDRCILLTCRIADYLVLMDGYIPALPCLLADRLREIIMVQDVDTVWSGLQEVFDWMIFVLACLPAHWSGLDWAFDILQRRLTLRYGKKWPSNWQEKQLGSLLCFVWSTTRFHDAFLTLCRKLLRVQHNVSDPGPTCVTEVPLDES